MEAEAIMVPSTDGVQVAAYDFGGDGPDLLLCHANGFHGHVWMPVVEMLRPFFRCLALDFRGHGQSVAPADLTYGWAGFGDDVLAVVDGFDLGPGLLVAGWSMGGCAALMAEQNRPGTVSQLWAFEPIVFPPVDAPGESAMSSAARRRRSGFASRDEAFENYSSKPPFSWTDARSLRAYVDYGFRDLEDGTVTLRCRPETEGDIFDQSVSPAWPRLCEVDAAVTVVGSGDGGPPAMMAPMIVEQLPNARFEPMPELTHFGPMQDPERIAASIIAALLDEES